VPGFHEAARHQIAVTRPRTDDFWLEHLDGVPDLPLDSLPGAGSGRVRELPVPLEEVDQDAVRAASQRLGTTSSAVYLAAWVLALRDETSARDFALGTPLAGRIVAEAEDVVGCFASSAILRFPGTVGDGDDCLRYAADLLEQALTDQYVPLERILWTLAPEPTGRNPFCQVGFVVQNNSHDTLTLGDLPVGRIRLPQTESVFEMALVLWPGSTLGSHLWFRDDAVSDDRAARLITGWLHHVRSLGTTPEA
jgi:non-ribosomal peptide synthetase component F